MRCTLDICAKGATDIPFDSIFAYRQSIFAQARKIFARTNWKLKNSRQKIFILTFQLSIKNIPSSTADATAVPLPHKDCFAIGGRLVWVANHRGATVCLYAKPNDFRLYVKNCLEKKKQFFWAKTAILHRPSPCGEGGPTERRWMRGYWVNRYLRQRRKRKRIFYNI